MKYVLSTVVAALVTFGAAAHPGHDHAYTPGGEWHHLLWIGVGVAAIAGLGVWAYRKRRAR